MPVVRPAGLEDVAVLTRLREEWAAEQQGGPVDDPDAAHRDGGVGRRLLGAALDHARERDFARVVLSPSERSVPFYERAGFAPATSLMVHDLS